MTVKRIQASVSLITLLVTMDVTCQLLMKENVRHHAQIAPDWDFEQNFNSYNEKVLWSLISLSMILFVVTMEKLIKMNVTWLAQTVEL